MKTEIINQKVWRKLEDGTMELVSNKDIEVEVPTTEEIIADKEAEMLAMYNEIQKLKEE